MTEMIDTVVRSWELDVLLGCIEKSGCALCSIEPRSMEQDREGFWLASEYAVRFLAPGPPALPPDSP